MENNFNKPWLSLKTVLRVRNFDTSKHFYSSILELPVFEEWNAPEGEGCVFGCGSNHREGFLEIYGMNQADPRYTPAFDRPFDNDKVDLQLGTNQLDSWRTKLSGRWPFQGPEKTPWGQRWIKLRDPDNMLIALYEGTDPGRVETKER